MRILLLSFMLAAAPAMAQAPAEGISQPNVPSPAAPVAPTSSMPPLAPAGVSSNPPQNNLMQQLQKIMGKKANSDSVGQVIVIGSLLGCTQKTAGQDATNAFYSQMQATGKSIEAYCKQHQAKQARELLLKTLDENKDNTVVKSALTCYDAQQPTLASVGGPRIATDAANYAKWIRDPELAKREVKESDICRNKTVSSINANTITVHP